MSIDLPVGRIARRAELLAAYALPAAMVWAALGLVVSALPLRQVAAVTIAVYAASYGAIEITGRARPAPPGSRWQVPQSLVLGVSRRRRLIVWGSILGPGFVTRNPYAGFAVLPLAVAALGTIRAGLALAVTLGLVHGTSRGLALLRDVRTAAQADYGASVLRSMYWRMLDGYLLLVIAGAAAALCSSVL